LGLFLFFSLREKIKKAPPDRGFPVFPGIGVFWVFSSKIPKKQAFYYVKTPIFWPYGPKNVPKHSLGTLFFGTLSEGPKKEENFFHRFAMKKILQIFFIASR